MKYTLLEMTQQILLAMDGDEVADIDETPESSAVARIIKEAYYDIAGELDLPEHQGLFKLTETGVSTPVVMTVPTDVMSIDWVKYNQIATGDTSVKWTPVKYLDWTDFLYFVNGWDADNDTTIDQYTYTDERSGDTFTLKCQNDNQPVHYSTPNDYTIVFDAYDSDEDDFLESAKTMCFGMLAPDFTLSNSFTPDLDHRQFAVLLNEAKAQCFADLKQQVNARAEKKARRNWISSQKKKRNVPYGNDYYYNSSTQNYPNYGRK